MKRKLNEVPGNKKFHRTQLLLPFKLTILLLLVNVQIFASFNSYNNPNAYKSTSTQQKKITGTVTDATNGEAIVGATILIEGTTIGTITDFDGKFSLDVAKENAVLIVKFLGFNTQNIPVGDQTNLSIKLTASNNNLDEVVVVGYGTVKRTNLTGSVTSLQSKSITSYPVTNVSQALQGQVAGVNITSGDGRPDAQMSIRIRGGGSITQSNDPLYIVDGFPVNNINDIPSAQIENISILKDASSTAIYGARGANGVVLITTKGPKVGKVNISYDGNYQIKKASKYISTLSGSDFVLLNWEYGTLMSASVGDAWERAYGLGTKYSTSNPAGFSAYQTAENRDIQKELLKTSYSQNHNLSINGGTDKTKYSLSLDYVNDDGLKIQSYYKRTNIFGKLQQELVKGLVLDLDVRVTNSNTFGDEAQVNGKGSKLTEAIRFTPVKPLGDISSTNTQMNMYEAYVRPNYDPIDVINDIYNKTDNFGVRGNGALTWTIMDGLVLKSEFNTSTAYSNTNYFKGAIAKNTVGVEGGDAYIKKSNSSSYRMANTLNYNVKALGKQHNLDLLLGEELSSSKNESSKMSGTRYPMSYNAEKVFANMGQAGAQSEISISNIQDTPYRLSSFFGRANYSFSDRYLVSATLRADASSNFAPSHRWGFFPAVALAWRMSEESFVKSISAIDNLKLRLSYGQAGNDRINSNLWQPLWSSNSGGYSYSDIGNPYYLALSKMMTNPDLKWETTITRNIGIDYGFFNSRVYGSIDGYWNTTKDLLLVTPITPYAGYENTMANVAQTRNLGLELSLGVDIIRSTDLKVSASVNIGINRNKIEELADNMDYYNYSSQWGSSSTVPTGGDYTLIKGQPVGLIRGYVQDGYYKTSDFNYDAATKTYTLKQGVPNSRTVTGNVPGVTGSYPGMIKFKKLNSAYNATDVNETDDATVIGNLNPKHTGGFNLNATYKGFDMLMAFNWSYGNDIYNANKLANTTGLKTPFRNFLSSSSNWYHLFKVDDSGNLVRVYEPSELDALNANTTQAMPFHENAVVHSGGIEDGSFLRLNNVTLGYTLPNSLTKKAAIQRLRFYMTISNVWIWTKYTGYDPEVDAGTGKNSYYPTPGMDFGAYPKARSFTFGVNLNF